MAVLAILIWLLATVVVGMPVGLLLRRLDATDEEEVVDPVELRDAMGRHPSRSKVA
jgi:hypothetical protein